MPTFDDFLCSDYYFSKATPVAKNLYYQKQLGTFLPIPIIDPSSSKLCRKCKTHLLHSNTIMTLYDIFFEKSISIFLTKLLQNSLG